MGEVSSFLNTSIIPDRQNSIYLNYKSPSSDSEASLNAKIFTNEAQLAFSKDVIVDIAKPIIEADIQNLYWKKWRIERGEINRPLKRLFIVCQGSIYQTVHEPHQPFFV